MRLRPREPRGYSGQAVEQEGAKGEENLDCLQCARGFSPDNLCGDRSTLNRAFHLRLLPLPRDYGGQESRFRLRLRDYAGLRRTGAHGENWGHVSRPV